MSLNGIDISHHQGEAGMTVSIFEKMSFDFAIMKATDGTRFVDAWCDKYYQSAKKRGKLLGVYHYANGTNAEKEVDYFLTHCKNYVGEALIALDWEKAYNQSFDNPNWAKQWLDIFYQKTGIRPLIYMSDSVTEAHNWSDVAKNYGLWIAQYPDDSIVHGYQSNPWRDGDGQGAFAITAIHQYTASGRISPWTGNLDLDIAYMSKEAWGKYAKGNGTYNPDSAGGAGSTGDNSTSGDNTSLDSLVGKEITVKVTGVK